MRRFIVGCLLTAIVQVPVCGYTYYRGMQDGVVRYQKSDRFAYTLEAAFIYGVRAGQELKCGGKK